MISSRFARFAPHNLKLLTKRQVDPHTRGNIIDELLMGGMMVTSHLKYALGGMDFGPIFGDGYIKALRLPAKGTTGGLVIVLPQLQDGSCKFLVTEQPKTIQCLLEDEIFIRFTRNGDALAIVPAPISSQPNGTKTLSTLRVSNVDAPHVGAIQVIQLCRPEAKNAISRQMLQELCQQIEETHSEKSASGTRALILASAVDDVFCAGADLKERKSMSPSETQEFLTDLRAMFSRLAALPIPTIACVSGLALGGGLELTLCCHLQVFSSNARVGLPETRLAIIPGAGGTHRLSKVVGVSNASNLVLTGRHLQASEAASMGLCHRLVALDVDGDTQSADKKRALSIQAGIALAQEIGEDGPAAVRAAVSALALPGEEMENSAYDSILWEQRTASRLCRLLARSASQSSLGSKAEPFGV